MDQFHFMTMMNAGRNGWNHQTNNYLWSALLNAHSSVYNRSSIEKQGKNTRTEHSPPGIVAKPRSGIFCLWLIWKSHPRWHKKGLKFEVIKRPGSPDWHHFNFFNLVANAPAGTSAWCKKPLLCSLRELMEEGCSYCCTPEISGLFWKHWKTFKAAILSDVFATRLCVQSSFSL